MNEMNGYLKVKDKNENINIVYPITKVKNVQGLPSTATVGQIIIVKTVDETGRPVEWECVDPGTRFSYVLDGSTLNITTI